MPETTKPRKRFAIGIIAATFFLAGCSSRCSLDEALAAEGLAENRIECGFVERAADRAAINACVTAAFESGRAFEARYELQGIDSHIVEAFVGVGDGRVIRLDYDGKLNGGLLSSWEYVRRYTCERPQLVEATSESDYPPIECERLVGGEMACETTGVALWFAFSDRN
jgi:hypothetical protein